MHARLFGTGAFILLLLAAISAQAQMLPPPGPLAPPPGFVPPYEIMRTVRSAGFDPVAPPLREGTSYVLRATDFRGILMRVVVDANTGAIRAVNRIVPGPGTSGQIGTMPPYSASVDDMPPYGALPEFDGADAPDETGSLPPPQFVPWPPAFHPTTRATVTVLPPLPPLPRPRPAELASRKPGEDAKPPIAPNVAAPSVVAPSVVAPSVAAPSADAKSEIKSDVKTAAPAPAKPGKPAPGPPIND